MTKWQTEEKKREQGIPMPPKRRKPPKTYPICSWKRALERIQSQCGPVHIAERHGKGEHKVIFLPEAARELEVMVSYGRRSPMNAKEQKYTGYGHYLMDENGHVTVIVKHLIEIQTMNRSPVSASNLGPNGEYNPGLDFLAYHREEFLRTEDRYNTDAWGHPVDPFLSLCGPSEFVLEGHTHPDLGVFYSRTDQVSGAARAASLPVCIFVCDPIRREMLGSIGRNFEEAEVIVYARDRDFQEQAGVQPASPVEEAIGLASRWIRNSGCAGTVRFRNRMGGRGCLTIKLVLPPPKGSDPTCRRYQKSWAQHTTGDS